MSTNVLSTESVMTKDHLIDDSEAEARLVDLGTGFKAVLADLFPLPELPWLGIWIPIILALASLPYLVAYAVTPQGREFMGFLPYLQDSNSYLAKMQQGAQGQWLFHLTYSPEPSTGTLAFSYYLLLGKASRLLGLPLILMYHLARVLNGFLLLLALYAFIGQFTKDLRTRRTAFLLASISAGLGWIALAFGFTNLGGDLPMDVHFPDSTTFWTLFAFPHYLLAEALMLLASIGAISAVERRSWRWSVAAGLTTLILGLVLPFGVITIYAVWGAFFVLLVVKNGLSYLRILPYVAIPVLIAAPMVVYSVYMSGIDSVYQGWTAQNVCISPGLANLLVAYGPILPFAGAGAYWIVKRGAQRMYLIAGWVLIIPLLLYVPTLVQRRVIIGWHMALAISAAIGLAEVFGPRFERLYAGRKLDHQGNHSLRKGPRQIGNYLVLIALPSTLLIVGLGLAQGLRHEYPNYLYKDDTAGLTWLRTNTQPEDIVLSGWLLGTFIPAWSGNRVFVGHWAETVNSADKTVKLREFFRNGDDRARQALLTEYHIRYVYYGTEEKALGNLEPGPYLEEVFSNDRVQIYRFTGGS